MKKKTLINNPDLIELSFYRRKKNTKQMSKVLLTKCLGTH
jgi:hypothetical protein